MYNDELTAEKWALNSAVECHPHTVEVVGSNPTAPTIITRCAAPCLGLISTRPLDRLRRSR